jgi:hypothetical protein
MKETAEYTPPPIHSPSQKTILIVIVTRNQYKKQELIIPNRNIVTGLENVTTLSDNVILHKNVWLGLCLVN